MNQMGSTSVWPQRGAVRRRGQRRGSASNPWASATSTRPGTAAYTPAASRSRRGFAGDGLDRDGVTEPIVATIRPSSHPRTKSPGQRLHAGALNSSGPGRPSGVASPNLSGQHVRLDADFPTRRRRMAVLGIAKGVIEDSCDGCKHAGAGGDRARRRRRARPTTSARRPPVQNNPSASPRPTVSNSPLEHLHRAARETPSPLLSMFTQEGFGVQGSTAGAGTNTNQIDLVWADYNPCRQKRTCGASR